LGAPDLECAGRIINEKGVPFLSINRALEVNFVLPTTQKD